MPDRTNEPATKGDLQALESRFDAKFADFKDEILRHFDVTVETMRHDLLGINADKIEGLKDRIGRVEVHVGLAR